MAGDNFVVWRERKTEDIGLDSARSRSVPVKAGQASSPDPEVVEKASRRRFTAEYKLRIVREAEPGLAVPSGCLMGHYLENT